MIETSKLAIEELEKTLELSEQLAKIPFGFRFAKAVNEIDYTVKNRTSLNYKYADEGSIYPKINAAMAKWGIYKKQVTFTPNMRYKAIDNLEYSEERTYEEIEYINKEGGRTIYYRTDGIVELILGDALSDKELYYSFPYTGQQTQDPAKMHGGTYTYFSRYAYLKIFDIPTGEDDPDYAKNLAASKKELRDTYIELKGLKTPTFDSRVIVDFLENEIFKSTSLEKITQVINAFDINIINNITDKMFLKVEEAKIDAKNKLTTQPKEEAK